MQQIKIFRPETYPDEIVTIRDNLLNLPSNIKEVLQKKEYLRDYINEEIWNTGSPVYNLHQDLLVALDSHEIVAFHNTRLPGKDCIVRNGLIFSDGRYIEMLRTGMRDSYVCEARIDEIIEIVSREISRWNVGHENKRQNQTCFIYDFDYYEVYNKFLATFGGEFMEFGLSAHVNNGSLASFRDVLKIGCPYVVEFSIPFIWINKYDKMDVARHIIMEWITKDIRREEIDHRYDGRIEREIPPEKIIRIHEVNDDFSEIDKWLFERN